MFNEELCSGQPQHHMATEFLLLHHLAMAREPWNVSPASGEVRVEEPVHCCCISNVAHWLPAKPCLCCFLWQAWLLLGDPGNVLPRS